MFFCICSLKLDVNFRLKFSCVLHVLLMQSWSISCIMCLLIQFKLSLLNICFFFVKLLYYCGRRLFWSVIQCHGALSCDFCPFDRRMYNGVFQILRNSSSLELAVASFHLLTELGKVKRSLPFPPSVCHLSASSIVPCSAAPLSVDLGNSTIYNANVLF